MTMRTLAIGWVVAASSACSLDPVDPDGTFIVRGMAFDAAGAPAAGQTIYIYRSDVALSGANDALQQTSFREGVNASATYSATVEATGSFEVQLSGVEVNTADGDSAAYLCAVNFEQGVEDAYLASASGWHFFSDKKYTWDLGNLELWNGGAAVQADDAIAFSWEPGAPASELPSLTHPSAYYVWELGSGDLWPRWAEHRFGTSAGVPRAAFVGTATGLQWFVTTFSDDGNREFQHRSSLHLVSSLAASAQVSERARGLYAGIATAPFTNDGANDGDVDTVYELPDATTDIFIDIGGETFQHVFFYNLSVAHLENALIHTFACDAATVDVDCGTEIGLPWASDWEPVRQRAPVFVANSAGGAADWLRVSIASKSTASAGPFFESVAEIRVVD